MAQQSAPRRSVLIIDDDRRFADSLASILRQRGYRVGCVDTAEGAAAALSAPDAAPVVLTAGVDAVESLHADHPDLICVVMAAGVDAATAIAALRHGACDVFDKSADPGALFAVLDRCYGRVAVLAERAAAYEALRRAKEEAERASRGKSGFLATMSHELRTPLNAIIGFSEMMLREVLGPLGTVQYRTYAADIHESGAHLLQIINDILDLSKAEAGKLDLYEEVFELRDTIRSVRQLVLTRLRNCGLSESVELPPDLPLLRADERKTKQVLLNLVTNAIKYTPSGGHIAISGSFDPHSGLTLAVSDTGVGIAPDDIPRVLEPFEQVESSISRTHQGTGLGLPLVKAIMELHGGKLELKSEIGVGTRASVTFPPDRMVIDASTEPARSGA